MKRFFRLEFLAVISFLMISAPSTLGERIIALTSGNRLLIFDSASPGTISRVVNITGIGNNGLAAIDFRPATGGLYGFITPLCLTGGQCSSDLYEINYLTGAATRISSVPSGFLLSRPPPPPSSFDIDFEPATDRIRFTDDRGENSRINPSDTDARTNTTQDTYLTYASSDVNAGQTPHVAGSAYTNSFATAGQTTLYNIDSNLDVLTIQNPANAGTLKTVGPLGVNTSDIVGLDISGTTGVAYASLTEGAVGFGVIAKFYTVDLVSGAATLLGTIADAATLNGEVVKDIAAGVPPSSKLLNISTRGRVGVGDDVLIGGFITRDGVGSRYLLRAIGPSLTAFGISSPLSDPVLMLKDGNGTTIATNDDWQSNQAADITATGLAPTNAQESAILISLPGGIYTGVVSGKGSATGVAVVEIYQLP